MKITTDKSIIDQTQKHFISLTRNGSIASRIACIVLFPILLIVSVSGQTVPERMTNEKLQKILNAESKKVVGQLGNWRIDYKGVPLMVITDKAANRMRIISPIIEEKKLTVVDMKKLLEANFDTALDAKYALYRGVLWSTFAHPLGELSESQFIDGLKQVFSLLRTYGTTYSSTDVVFGAEPPKEQIGVLITNEKRSRP